MARFLVWLAMLGLGAYAQVAVVGQTPARDSARYELRVTAEYKLNVVVLMDGAVIAQSYDYVYREAEIGLSFANTAAGSRFFLDTAERGSREPTVLVKDSSGKCVAAPSTQLGTGRADTVGKSSFRWRARVAEHSWESLPAELAVGKTYELARILLSDGRVVKVNVTVQPLTYAAR